ncbi:uncharacterized protein A1O9_09195 [Exophiala aquamarina CBS 119918]|uniref:Chromatin assembly factor 1 subunit A n=1 Tax=Exophiala aquamarina CBS 119918 TaxID=1182545 RepID=A0A072P655_9EURO|nr:uncharacterized protein A1O9_09195 [Exophiala aquamarina CBS 119918]KEF54753.1 hypothetical protein A1O9_09195 [Exophiala aquamarina CBS 119918]
MDDPLPATLVVPSILAEQLTPASKKRNYDGELISHANSLTPPLDHHDQSSETFSRAVSPTLSTDSTPLTELGPTPSVSPQKSHDMAPESKKRKLTFAEREVEKAVKKSEKEEKERQKAEMKAKKDEEKKRKEEEKEAARKAKDAVKADKQKAKETAQQEKDAEKKRKEAETLKKERAQLRIGAFFGRPALASTPPTTPDDVSIGASSRRSSIASTDVAPSLVETRSPAKARNHEYNQWILPFFVNEHTELAPINRFHSKSSVFDQQELPLNQNISPEKVSGRFRRLQRARKSRPVKELIETLEVPTKESTNPRACPQDLDRVSYKCLFFHTDVRPAYQGTYTRAVSPRSTRKIACNPTHRGLPDTNYDYDSEAEWQEPEEGDDDLMDEDELSEDDAGEEEMDDFVDDDGEPIKRQLIVGNMEPKSTGLCWEDTDSRAGCELSSYRMDVLHDATTLPIDPFSSQHWSDIGKPSPKKKALKSQASPAGMQPPRLPLMAVDGNAGGLGPSKNTLGFPILQDQNGDKQVTAISKGNQTTSGKPVKMIPADLLPAFKSAVVDSTLSKVGLIEVLKNQFPKCSKDAIKDTLSSIAVRQGTEKKWVLI